MPTDADSSDNTSDDRALNQESHWHEDIGGFKGEMT